MSAAPSHVAEVVSATACPPAATISSTTPAASAPVRNPTSFTTTDAPFGREELGVLAPDAAARAGDDRDLPVQTSAHGAGGYGSAPGARTRLTTDTNRLGNLTDRA